MKPQKIYIWESQLIIAHDIKNILTKSGFEATIIRTMEGLDKQILVDKPLLFILCLDTDHEKNLTITSAAKNFNIPVFVLSSFNKNLTDKMLNIAIAGFLMKPFDKNELVECVTDCLNKDRPPVSRKYNFQNQVHLN